jgi:exopolyphosphatase/pppGpp-phosphohydrolase
MNLKAKLGVQEVVEKEQEKKLIFNLENKLELPVSREENNLAENFNDFEERKKERVDAFPLLIDNYVNNLTLNSQTKDLFAKMLEEEMESQKIQNDWINREDVKKKVEKLKKLRSVNNL